ncbi:MAG: hypothetical protein PHE32_03190 [Candidatus Shapirobacteria bacterium]|nr:hypothetical protein [Candidatus Shapirobacteria bacterium]MDD4410677.1 hypothetical protein [Candidatus Shapirobacteria bacterium]
MAEKKSINVFGDWRSEMDAVYVSILAILTCVIIEIIRLFIEKVKQHKQQKHFLLSLEKKRRTSGV